MMYVRMSQNGPFFPLKRIEHPFQDQNQLSVVTYTGDSTNWTVLLVASVGKSSIEAYYLRVHTSHRYRPSHDCPLCSQHCWSHFW